MPDGFYFTQADSGTLCDKEIGNTLDKPDLITQM
jgi:hypothetical protein